LRDVDVVGVEVPDEGAGVDEVDVVVVVVVL
jgi:hypothetical protein